MGNRATRVFREYVDVRGLVTAVVLILGVSIVPEAPSHAAISPLTSNPTPFASLGALQLALKHAETIQTVPSGLSPTLVQVASAPFPFEGASYQHTNCNPYSNPSEATHPNPCWYGSLVATAPIVVLFGDSFVGNWIPALDIVGQKLGFRIASFEFSGCDTPDVTATVGSAFTPAQVAACNLWHSTLPKEVASLHPKAIIAANGAPDWGTPGDSSWISGMKYEFSKMNPKGLSAQILLGTGPHLTSSAPACLAASFTSVQKCTYHFTLTSNFAKALARDASAVKLVHVHLVPTYQWVCVSAACPMIINSTLVFVDTDHLSTNFSLQMSSLLTAALRPLLPH